MSSISSEEDCSSESTEVEREKGDWCCGEVVVDDDDGLL